MVIKSLHFIILSFLLVLGACASKSKDQMQSFRTAYVANEFDKADEILKTSELRKDKKSELLLQMERGTLRLAQGNETAAIKAFQKALDLIDALYTKKISAKAATFLVNDASDVFYGASYERSYAHYFLAKSYYARYQKLQNKLDLQGSRATILAWDTYFTELQRSAAPKTIYQTDLMMKVFGGEIHEVSQIRTDKQISLQLYKDALDILNTMGGAFEVFNSNSKTFIKDYETALGKDVKPAPKSYSATSAQQDFKDFLHFKILSLTREIRNTDFQVQVKALKPSEAVLKKVNGPKTNVVIVLEEGLIPQKVPRVFNFGLKGAVDSVESPAAKAFIQSVGTVALSAFAMNTLGMTPEKTNSPGGFIFGYEATKLAVNEAAISFELPMIEASPKLADYNLYILDEKGKILKQETLAVISENGAIAKLVLEEDAVSRYVRTGTRVAIRHILAIVAAMQVHQKLKENGAFIAGTAAMATYVGASKGIAALEKADVRHWTTIPGAFRMSELNLAPGTYQVAISSKIEKPNEKNLKILGDIKVIESVKDIHHLKLSNL